MTVRYNPDAIARLNIRRKELAARVSLGTLSEEEAQVLFEHAVHQEMIDTKPRLRIVESVSQQTSVR